MRMLCSTRSLKNAKFLQTPAVGYLPAREPLEGFASLVPPELLMKLDRIPPEEIRIPQLARALSKARPQRPGAKARSPLFSGTLNFVQATFSSSGRDFAVSVADQKIAVEYAALAAVPISRYASQYGPNSLAVAPAPIPFMASVSAEKYNDGILSGWVEQLSKSGGLSSDTCLVFLNPQGVVNTDADPSQGVLGYHSVAPSGTPYIFVNVMGTGLSVSDERDVYALALSHECAEMTVDPRADGSNPECCDSCGGNCNVDNRDFFDGKGVWVGGSPTPGALFFIAGIATPAAVARCPAPASSCSYPPPQTPS
jgi:hypothetical protein